MELTPLLQAIGPADQKARLRAKAQWSAVAKPLGGLGLLETAIEDIAALTGDHQVDLSRRTLLVLCADNGVTAQGVTQAPSSVTTLVARNLASGTACVSRMAACANCQVVPVDMGILDFEGMEGVLDRRLGNGTQDISQGPAMSREDAISAIRMGMELVREQAERGCTLLATGEVGIGNTTTSAAVTCALLDRSPAELSGRGAGLSDEGLIKKQKVIAQALALNHPDPADPVDVLAKVGGFDLAGLCGVFLGGALYKIPVLIDGIISSAAALCAVRLCPNAEKAMLASHLSAEPAGIALLDALGKKPLLTAGLRLGEGTGAVAAIPLLDMALAVYREAATFADCGLDPYVPQGGQ